MSVFKANSNACEESLIWLCNCNRRPWTRLKNRDKRNLWGFERRPLSTHGHTIERLRRRRESQHKTVFRRRHGKRQQGYCSSERMAAALASPPCGSLQAQWIYSSLTRLAQWWAGELCLSVPQCPTNLPGFQCGSWLRWQSFPLDAFVAIFLSLNQAVN